ncbi:MAG: PspC domain-containing protein [Micrococcales bacterium]|nr:PspC domain-containing protein [Micrococcales bacterium]
MNSTEDPTPAGTGDAPTPGPQHQPPPQSTSPGDGFFSSVRRLGVTRSEERWIGGVCGGLAQRLGLDPLLVRGILAVTVLISGLGLVAYGVAWALLPEARDGRIHLQETIAGRFDTALLGALGFAVAGLVRGEAVWWFGRAPGDLVGLAWLQGLGWLLVVGTVVAVVIVAVKSSSGPKEPPMSSGNPLPSESSAPSTSSAHPSGPVPPPPAPAAASMAASAPPPVWTPPPPTMTPPPPPRRPHPSGPGGTTVGVVAALVLLTVAGLLLARRTGHTDAPVLLTAAGVGVVLLGLGIVVSGLRGRTSGVLGFFAVVTLLLSLPAVGWAHWSTSPRWVAGDVVVVSDTIAAKHGFEAGVGSTVLDLRPLELEGATVQVPVSMGVGDLEILLPAGVEVRAEVSVGIGSVSWDVGDNPQRASGIGLSRTYVAAGDDGTIKLEVSLGVGELTVSQKTAPAPTPQETDATRLPGPSPAPARQP